MVFAFPSLDTLYIAGLKASLALPHRSSYFVRPGVKLMTTVLEKWFLQYPALTASHLKLGEYKLIFVLMSVPEGNLLTYSVK